MSFYYCGNIKKGLSHIYLVDLMVRKGAKYLVDYYQYKMATQKPKKLVFSEQVPMTPLRSKHGGDHFRLLSYWQILKEHRKL